MRNNPADTSRFWIVSAALHVAALILVLLTPAGQTLLHQPDRAIRPEIVKQDEELADVIDQVRALAIGRLQGPIGRIEVAGREMEDRLVTRARSYEGHVKAQLSSVSDRVVREGERLVHSQKALFAALEEFSRTRESGRLKTAFEENRAAITEGQEEMRRAAQLAREAGREFATRQERLADEQFAVFERIITTFEKQADYEKLKTRLTEFIQEEKILRTTITQTAPRMEMLPPLVETAKQKRTELFQVTRKAETRSKHRKIDLAKAEQRGQGIDDARTALEAAQTESETSRAELSTAGETLKNLSAELSLLRKERSDAAKRLPVLEKEIPHLTTRVPELAREGEAALAAALPAQRQVGKTQEKLCLELKTLLLSPPSSQEAIP